MKLTIGTRGSKLALAQVDLVVNFLSNKFPDLRFEKKIIRTTGDNISDAPLSKIGGKGLFVKEIDEAVVRGEVDFAVHSAKDVPTEMLEDLEIASVPERGDIGDALISRNGGGIDDLPNGAVVGTSSLRRRAEILNYRSDIQIRDLRGNIDTRLRKLDSQEYDAIIMARAGLKRLGFADRITEELPLDSFPPSVGQGAIAIVTRKDSPGKEYITAVNHPESMVRIKTERALLKSLGGGCQVPIGAVSAVNGGIILKGVIISPSGENRIDAAYEGATQDAERIGVEVAKRLLEGGADEILKEVYGESWSD
ncbi:MAG: hydroxymethylbilane synthase [Candidatus Hydrothermarchaeaceae archaeon]